MWWRQTIAVRPDLGVRTPQRLPHTRTKKKNPIVEMACCVHVAFVTFRVMCCGRCRRYHHDITRQIGLRASRPPSLESSAADKPRPKKVFAFRSHVPCTLFCAAQGKKRQPCEGITMLGA